MYTSRARSRSLMADNGVSCSMSRSGNFWDNAAMESFGLFTENRAHRAEGLPHRGNQARADVFDYIELFYNPQRRHSTIGYVSPMEFERICSPRAKDDVHQTGSSSDGIPASSGMCVSRVSLHKTSGGIRGSASRLTHALLRYHDAPTGRSAIFRADVVGMIGEHAHELDRLGRRPVRRSSFEGGGTVRKKRFEPSSPLLIGLKHLLKTGLYLHLDRGGTRP